ncbi:MAG: hypothetical protein JSU77_10445 [Fidelibacterota bacterium]|nr:MAG: hypothetical protein JSU77_10445 [Candidatus Neomarinimicrobiota bacterium]
MKKLLLACCIIWLSCEEVPPDVLYGESFELACGESVLVEVETGEIEVGFQAVLIDSRCPLDAECLWPGWARIQLWLHRPGQDTIYLEPFIYGDVFKEDTTTHKRVFSEEYTVTLLQLDPYPSSEIAQVDPDEYTALLSFSLNPVPLETYRLNLVAWDVVREFLNNPIDGFDIDSTAVVTDTLLVYVNYGGGCKEHDFFLFGSTCWGESDPPSMLAVIIHDGHWDMCKALIHETLRFDLSPIRDWQGDSGTVKIIVKDAPDAVRYHY